MIMFVQKILLGSFVGVWHFGRRRDTASWIILKVRKSRPRDWFALGFRKCRSLVVQQMQLQLLGTKCSKNWKFEELCIIFIPTAACGTWLHFPMEIIVCVIYIFRRNVEEKVVEGRNVHFLTPAVFQAQEYVWSVASLGLRQQSWIVIVQPTKLKIFTVWPFIGKAANREYSGVFLVLHLMNWNPQRSVGTHKVTEQ